MFTDGTAIDYFGTGWAISGGTSENCARFRPQPWDIYCGEEYKHICTTPSVPGKTELKTSIVSFRSVHGESLFHTSSLTNQRKYYCCELPSFKTHSLYEINSQIQHGKIPINHVLNFGIKGNIYTSLIQSGVSLRILTHLSSGRVTSQIHSSTLKSTRPQNQTT